MSRVIVLLPVKPETLKDIADRIIDLGPIYQRDFLKEDRRRGLVVVLGEVGLFNEERK